MVMASTALPPVASMGSSTSTSRSSMSEGSLQKYSTGCKVSSLRYSPMKPTLAAGIRLSMPSSMPMPARRMGTRASLRPASTLVRAMVMGVSI